MYIPRDFGDPVQTIWNRVNEAMLCDEACERRADMKDQTDGQYLKIISFLVLPRPHYVTSWLTELKSNTESRF